MEIVKKTKNNWRFVITGNVISSTITNKVVLGTINPDLSKLKPAFHIIDEYAFSTLPITNIVIPSNIDTLSVNSFSNCKSLKSVELPNNITTIPVKCFMNNYSLSEINLENVTVIGDSAFQMSIALSECNLNNIENIGRFAFASSTMRKVTIGRNISFIQSYAFNCGRLNDITCLATVCPSTSSSAFTDTPETGVLKVPTGSDYSSWLEQLGSGWTIEYI